jgi:ERCC4-type nuclease
MNSSDVQQEVGQRQKDFEARLKELLGDARVAEQKTEQANRDREAQERETARDEQRVRDQMATAAVEVGVDPAAANRFFDQVKAMKPDMEAKFSELEKSLTGTPEEKQKKMQVVIKAELEKVAIETMGPNGPALIDKMMKDH